MAKKTKKIAKKKRYIVRWETVYNRYQRNYNLIIFLGLVAVVAVWYFTNHFWGLTTLAFGIWSWIFYDDGAQENCIDEWEYAYPQDGFLRMFKSCPWFIGFAVIAYFICKHSMPWLFD